MRLTIAAAFAASPTLGLALCALYAWRERRYVMAGWYGAATIELAALLTFNAVWIGTKL